MSVCIDGASFLPISNEGILGVVIGALLDAYDVENTFNMHQSYSV